MLKHMPGGRRTLVGVGFNPARTPFGRRQFTYQTLGTRPGPVFTGGPRCPSLNIGSGAEAACKPLSEEALWCGGQFAPACPAPWERSKSFGNTLGGILSKSRRVRGPQGLCLLSARESRGKCFAKKSCQFLYRTILVPCKKKFFTRLPGKSGEI